MFGLDRPGSVIAGLSAVTWVVAPASRHFGHAEERWSTRPRGRGALEAGAFDEFEDGPGSPARPGV